MLPETLQAQLTPYGFSDFGEVALREALEAHVETYTLIKLAAWPARRCPGPWWARRSCWGCRRDRHAWIPARAAGQALSPVPRW